MFNYFKEIRGLKRSKLQLEVLILSKIYDLTKVIDGASDILEVAKAVMPTDKKNASDMQKEIVSNLVTYLKTKEESKVSE